MALLLPQRNVNFPFESIANRNDDFSIARFDLVNETLSPLSSLTLSFSFSVSLGNSGDGVKVQRRDSRQLVASVGSTSRQLYYPVRDSEELR